ncbi:MAG TPA: BTAD domain-containing putative transcriptional regulator [Micromonosporaceae bacterium]|nr:BTAD domain-containing putative transcriptional regulator [Micromonosporaceae bacterium]
MRAPHPHGLRRARLVRPLVTPDAPRLTLVVAPAGSGKSTLLTHVAESVGCAVAWLTLDGTGGDVAEILAHLHAAFAAVLPGISPQWPTPEAALADLEGALDGPVLLILDDLHGAQADAVRTVVGPLLEYQPDQLRIILGSRRTPDLDIARRRLAGSMIELDADALRFRTWEVDELFRECHDVRLRPREISALTQRTAGWAAGLQLFHLATHRQPPSSRAALLSRGGTGSRLTQEYLARHVLDQVDVDVHAFLVRTSVLDQLTAQHCDALLGTTDAAARLAGLERAGLFTFADADGLVFRYHEVLRGHLLDELVARFGLQQAGDLHQQAGRLLEREGALVDAIRSYCRAGAWDDVRRLLATGGATLAREPGTWVDLLPVSIRDQDPWALLALARRLLAEGSLERASEMYQRAVDAFSSHGGGRTAAAELRQLQAWAEPTLGVVTDWVHLARSILVEPRKHLRQLAGNGSVADQLLQGYANLVCGELTAASEIFTGLDRDHDLEPGAETAALLGYALASTLAAPDDIGAGPGSGKPAIAREQATAAAKLFGVPVVSRLAHGLAAVAAGDRPAVEYLLGECRAAEDRWGAALLGLIGEVMALPLGTASPELLGSVEADLRALNAPALASWAGAGAALAAAVAGEPLPDQRLAGIELAARATGALPYALALLAVSAAPGDGRAAGAAGAERLGIQVAERCGAEALVRRAAERLPARVTAPGPRPGARTGAGAGSAARMTARATPRPPTPAARLQVRCLGSFTIEVGGAAVPLDALRPRYRELLRLLSLHANRVLHREHIIEWLWPGRDPDRGHHSLQVAVSDLRRLVEPDAPRGEWARIRREHSGYRLALDHDDDCDVRRLEGLLRAARIALGAGDESAAGGHLAAAIETYAGELLPDDGPAEWVVPERERLRNEVTEACERLAALRAARGGHAEAIRVLRYGIAQDRYRDGLWQQLISSLHASGNPAAAAAATTAYEQVLREMGLSGAGRYRPARPPH